MRAVQGSCSLITRFSTTKVRDDVQILAADERIAPFVGTI